MLPELINSIDQIDQKRVVSIKFPDSTFTLERFELENTKLTVYYTYKDVDKAKLEPYENNYSLDVFNAKGRVTEVDFKTLNITKKENT